MSEQRFADHAEALAARVRELEEERDRLCARERQAAARAAELDAILADVPVAVLVARDPEARHIDANRFGAELFRVPAGSNVSLSAPAGERRAGYRCLKDGVVLAPDDLPLQRAARSGVVTRDYEFDVAFEDGTVLHLMGSASPLVDERGTRHGAIGAFVDISHRKRAEDRAESLARFPQENPDPVLRLSSGFVALYANTAAVERLRDIGLELRKPAPPQLVEVAKRAVEAGRRIKAEVDCGTTVFSLSVVPVGAEVNVYAQDITARKQAEAALHHANEQLREADRRKDDFLGMLSHELRNPLAPIRTSIRVLQIAPPGGDQAQRAQRVIERQVEHLTQLVDDLLDVTRIVRGKIQLHRERVDLVAIARHTAEDHRALMYEQGVSLGVELPDAPAWVDGDANRLTQVLGNLLQNAAKFTGRGGRVTLRGALRGGFLELCVSDSGVGMDAELVGRLFRPFVQADQSLARTQGGLGLGLAIVRGITELHGGTVQASSAGPGKGSEFMVRVPLAAVASDAAPLVAAGGGGRARRVLVVDDSEDAAESLADLLGMLGHVVDVAFDGPSALEKARAHPPDVVLCDIGLPGMSGYEVATALRREHADRLEIYAVTGYARPEDVSRALGAGFDGHVAKPPDLVHIEQLLGFERRLP